MFGKLIISIIVLGLVINIECNPREKRQTCTPSQDFSPVPNDCTKFYRCANGVLSVFQCSSGLLFDNNLKVCNWPNQVTTCNTNQLQKSCTAANDLTRVENDCSKYYRCSNGVLSVQSCQSGLYFDTTTKTCNWATYVSCAPAATPKCDLSLDLTPTGYDCSKFYRCINGVLSVLTCPSGYLFDRNTKSCNPANLVTTCNNVYCNSGIDLTPVGSDCSQFYRCINGVQATLTCPSGYLFDRSLKVCNPSNQVVCNTCNPAIDLTPYPNDCSKFYKCINGVQTTLTCPGGYLFDKNAKMCNPSSQVSCTTCDPALDLTQVSNDCSKFYKCVNGALATLSCPSGYLFDKNSKSCNPSNLVTTCYSCASQHLTNVPGDCTRYYMCINNDLSIYNCPAGLTFDSSISNCRLTSQILGKCGVNPFPNCSLNLSSESRIDLCSQVGFRKDFPACC
ncbi:unnamed protein product [Brachionus calyciflorus]|uniref:Chitin-binding type-2 domain-containing protein n=1 Tax=Brachionus calyciflorus TaxID=104777 RepID=A0A814B198_9BILA|nr:unnamed protein product [Brachionus calyciflorus]